MHSVINGGWHKAEISLYKHAIAPYGAAMVGLPSQISYGSWQKIRHAIPPWPLFNNTGCACYQFYFSLIFLR